MITLAPIGRNLAAISSTILLIIFMTSCENESIGDNLQTNQIFSSGKVSALEMVTELLPYTDCESVCIEDGSGIYYYKSDFQTQTVGNPNNPNANTNTKKVSYIAYNTETEFVVEVLYDIIDGNSEAKADITITINGISQEFEEIAKDSKTVYNILLDDGWLACDVVNFSIKQEALGNPIEFSSSYALIGICEDCEESFSYKQNEDLTYTFTYNSEVDLIGAEVKLTHPHITGFTALDGKSYSVNPGNNNGAPTVLTWTGDIVACTPISFTLLLDADCNQNSAGFANLFTDFKVNGVSKKGDSENITFQCEE